MRDRFYWSVVSSDMELHIKGCERYLHFKSKPQIEELHPLIATHPLELVHTDFLTIELSKTDKEIDALVIIDYFTCYLQALVTPSKTAKVMAQSLWDKLFVNYVFLEKILHDQGFNFWETAKNLIYVL